jgi:hypothetical protein
MRPGSSPNFFLPRPSGSERPLSAPLCSALALLLAFWLPLATQAKTDDRAKAIAAAQDRLADCPKCLLFAVPTKGALIRVHQLFFVSTLDRTPPPLWTVAVSPSGKTYLLSSKDTKDWNAMIKEEKLALFTDDDAKIFAKMFLDLAAGRSLYIPKLTTAEIRRVEKGGLKSPAIETRITRNTERIGLSFYAKDVTGALQLWSLILSPNGQITKVEVKEY